ncbi:MAG: transcriptional regulator, family [Schlesneria sp.]|nr:transcriptional regulator, family [Schlesneria sp.]
MSIVESSSQARDTDVGERPVLARRVYVCGALHSAGDLTTARELYEFAADVCESCGFIAYLPHKTSDPVHHSGMSPVDVFVKDYAAVLAADVIVAFIGEASSGMGAELGIAFERNKQVIAVYEKTERPSPFILGMLSKMKTPLMSAYESKQDLRQILISSL